MNTIEIRTANHSDIEFVTKLFYETIQNINSRDYSQEEIDDWSSWYTDIDRWEERMTQQFFIVAIINNTIVGFSALAVDGYLDLMFVHKDYQRMGIASRLLQSIEEKAISQNNKQIYSNVSITAHNFFESKGYIVVQKKSSKSRDRELINYRMIKELTSH